MWRATSAASISRAGAPSAIHCRARASSARITLGEWGWIQPRTLCIAIDAVAAIRSNTVSAAEPMAAISGIGFGAAEHHPQLVGSYLSPG
jgi:hypothetical protein